MEDIYQWQYFISWQKLRANEVVVVMASGAAFGVCVTADVMMRWLGCLVHLDALWLWFFINSVGKQAAVPVPCSKGLLQMTVHYRKEMVFSHSHMFFGIPLCACSETCLFPSEMVHIAIECWNSERDWKTNKNVTKEVLILKGKGLAYW